MKKLNKNQIKFLEKFHSAPEPYKTIAEDAILWNDREKYGFLKRREEREREFKK